MSYKLAPIGLRGTVHAWRNVGMSGIGELLICKEGGDNKVRPIRDEDGFILRGDWRPIRNISESLNNGELVEVVEGEGSAYGCHSIRVIDGEDD